MMLDTDKVILSDERHCAKRHAIFTELGRNNPQLFRRLGNRTGLNSIPNRIE